MFPTSLTSFVAMKKRTISFLTVFISVLIFQSALGQEVRPPDSLKIGLALGGGGAKGFAHLGVLKVIDSLGVPINYIAGTSMGAVVGGFYAAGYSAEQIDSIAQSMDWSSIFNDRPERKMLSYAERWETGRFQIPLEINRFKFLPPSGLIAGQKVSLLLSRQLLPSCEITDFDSLTIPFRCVAADLITGEEVVLGNGSLAKAIRASMSVPSVFTPVAWGDSLLVDGGVVNNLPVDIVKKMGANFVIAVNVSTLERSRKELKDAISILRQSLSILSNLKEKENLNQADIALNPELKDFSLTDFKNKKILKMIQIGERTARKNLESLKRMVPNRPAKPHRIKNTQFPGGTIFGVHISGNRTLPFSFIYQLLGMKPGAILDINLLEKRIDYLYGLGYFETITYQVKHRPGNKFDLYIRVKEKKLNLARLGMRYVDDKKIIGAVNLKLGDFPLPGFRHEISFLFSGENLFEWEISYPRRWFGGQIFPYLNNFYRDIQVDIFSEREKVARYHKRSSGTALGFGLILNRWGILKADYILERLDVAPSIASSGGIVWPEWNHNLHLARVYSEIDQLDNPFLPKLGYKLQTQYEHTVGFIHQADHFQRFYLKSQFYFPTLPRLTTGLQFFLGLSTHAPLYGHFFLGGAETFVGMNYDEFAGPNVGIYRLDNYFRLNDTFSLMGIFNAGNIWQNYQEIDFSKNYFSGYGLGIYCDTIVGPVRYVFGKSGKKSFHYLSFGFNLTTHLDERM